MPSVFPVWPKAREQIVDTFCYNPVTKVQQEISCQPYLGLFVVKLFSGGCDQLAEALERLFIRAGTQQTVDALVHDPLGQHLEFEELSDEADIAQGPAVSLSLPNIELSFLGLLFLSLYQPRIL